MDRHVDRKAVAAVLGAALVGAGSNVAIGAEVDHSRVVLHQDAHSLDQDTVLIDLSNMIPHQAGESARATLPSASLLAIVEDPLTPQIPKARDQRDFTPPVKGIRGSQVQGNSNAIYTSAGKLPR